MRHQTSSFWSSFVPAPVRAFAALAVVGALVGFPSASRAQITDLEEVGTVTDDVLDPYPPIVYGLTVFGAFGSLQMTEFNEAVTAMNLAIQSQGTTVTMQPFNGFLGYGGGVRAIVKSRLLVEAIYEHVSQSETIGGISAKNQVEVPASALMVSLGWDFLKSKRDTRFGFLAGLGRYDSQAKQTLSEGRNDQDFTLGVIELKGKSWGSHYAMFFEKNVSDHMFIHARATYRVARVTDPEITGLDALVDPVNEQAFVAVPVVEETADGPRLRRGGTELDWSGFDGQVGFTYYFNIPTPW
ncbi:MAG: hypothetical protein R3B81_15885 [bacterium]